VRFRVQLFRQGEQPDEASADPVTVDLPALRRQLQALDGPAPTLEQVKALGTRLADILLPARARDIYRAAYSALGDTERLRLRMRFETFALADLPWEYIYLEPSDTPAGQGGLDGFLALDTKVSLVRYEVLQLPPATLDPVDTSDIRVVALMASTKAPGVLPLDLKAEAGYLTSALGKQGVRLDIEQDATLSSLETALTPPVHVFHFSGHGQFSGQQDDDLSSDGVGFSLLEGE